MNRREFSGLVASALAALTVPWRPRTHEITDTVGAWYKPLNGDAWAIRTFYISPTGDDRWEGTEARPFRTTDRAWEALGVNVQYLDVTARWDRHLSDDEVRAAMNSIDSSAPNEFWAFDQASHA